MSSLAEAGHHLNPTAIAISFRSSFRSFFVGFGINNKFIICN